MEHPAIRKEIDHQISEIESTYIILSVPLLIESDQYDFVDRVLVIDVPKNIQIARIKIRDANTEELIQEIIASQVSREMRLNRADDIIDNSGSQRTLRQKVLVLHEHYLQIANR